MLPVTTVSVSIEGKTAKALVTRSGRVVRWGSVPLDPDHIQDGIVLDPVQVGREIAQLLQSLKVKPKRVVTSVSGLYSLPRIVSFPQMPPSLMNDAVSQEFRRAAPVDLEELYLSWQVISATPEEQRVYLVGVPKQGVDVQVQTLQQIGVEPSIMQLKPLALAQASGCKDALIVNVQQDELDIVLVADGVPVLTRSDVLQRGVSTVESSMERVTQELVRTVEFFESNSSGRTLDSNMPLFITGDGEVVPILQQLIERDLGYPVSSLEPPLKYPSDFPVSEYATNIGLALRDYSARGISWGQATRVIPVNINILPEKYRKPKEMNKKVLWAAGAMAGLGLLFMLYQANEGASNETADLEAKLSAANQQVEERAQLSQRLGEIQEAIVQAEVVREALDWISKGYTTREWSSASR